MDRADPTHNLAIETSSRQGRIAFGSGGRLLEEVAVPEGRRHGVELTAALDRLLAGHQLGPADIGQIYVALGPGSFTGLRIGLATVKMLALSANQPIEVVGVPSIEVLQADYPQAIVCLNLKRGAAYCAGPGWPAELRSVEEIKPLGLPIVGEKIDGATRPAMRISTLWRLGRERAKAGRFDDPATLSPLYIREPEAVTLWRENSGE